MFHRYGSCVDLIDDALAALTGSPPAALVPPELATEIVTGRAFDPAAQAGEGARAGTSDAQQPATAPRAGRDLDRVSGPVSGASGGWRGHRRDRCRAGDRGGGDPVVSVGSGSPDREPGRSPGGIGDTWLGLRRLRVAPISVGHGFAGVCRRR